MPIKRFLPFAVFLLVVVALAVPVLRQQGGVRPIPSPLLGQEAPDFLLKKQGGGEISGDALKGKTAIVNFFASWCVACKAEQPALARLRSEGQVFIVGIAYKDKPQALEKFLQEYSGAFDAVALDEDGKVAIDFGVGGVPESFLIDPEGRVRYRHAGPVTEGDVDRIFLPAILGAEP